MRHFKIPSIYFYIGLLTLCTPKYSLSQNSTFFLDAAQILDSTDLLTQCAIWVDSTGKADFQMVTQQHFVLFSSIENRKISSFQAYWLKVTLQNTNPNTALNGYLWSAESMDIFDIYTDNNQLIGQGGKEIALPERAFQDMSGVVPFTLAANERKTFWIKMAELLENGNVLTLELRTNTALLKIKKQAEQKEKNRQKFYLIFLIVLMSVAIFALLQYIFFKDKANLWYSVYVITTVLFYLRNYEHDTNSVILFNYFGHFQYFEAPLSFITFSAYIYFFIYFFYLDSRSPKIAGILRGFVRIFFLLFLLSFPIFYFWGFKETTYLYNVPRVIFTILSFYFVYKIFQNSEMASHERYIGYGIIIVMTTILYTVFSDLTGWKDIWTTAGLFRYIQIGSISIPMYSVRLGIMFEMFFFSIALHQRMKSEKLENIETQNRLFSLNNEHEQLKKRLSIIQINHLENAPKNDFILRGEKIIIENISNEFFSVDDFAKAMNLSRSQLYKKWKEDVHEAPSESIRKHRVAHSAQLLRTTKLNISEIAYQSGFKDPAHFSNLFTEFMGKSPTEFRRQNDK